MNLPRPLAFPAVMRLLTVGEFRAMTDDDRAEFAGAQPDTLIYYGEEGYTYFVGQDDDGDLALLAEGYFADSCESVGWRWARGEWRQY